MVLYKAKEHLKFRRYSPEELKNKRKRLNLTQFDMAELLGVTKNTIYNYERGICGTDSGLIMYGIVLDLYESWLSENAPDYLNNIKELPKWATAN